MSYRSLIFVALSCCLGACHAADHVKLTNGLDVEGQIVCDAPSSNPLVSINTGSKLLLFNRSEISSITHDDDGRAEYTRRRDAIKGKNAPAHFELYQWAKSQHFFDYADVELSATLKADPSHAEARKIAFAPATLSKPTPAAAQVPVAKAPPADDGPVIGMRPVAPAAKAQASYDEKIDALCKTLLPGSPADDAARKAALTALFNDRAKAVESMATRLDPTNNSDEQTRLAALVGIEALKPASPGMSIRLAQAAIADPFIPVRKQTLALIKSRNDEYAMNAMVNTYVSAFGESGETRNPLLKAAAGAALKGLEDKRVYGALFYRATMEVRTAVADLNSLTTRQIDSYTVNNGAQASVLVPLSFPIQFPELAITSIKTTVCAPCSALSDLTGQNFGNDLDQWAKWIRMQK